MQVPNHPLFESLKELSLPAEDFAIFGSGPMWVRDIRTSSDLDIIARGRAWEWVQKHGVKTIKEGSLLECWHFSGQSIEVYNGWYPGEWDIDELIDTADVVDGIRFVALTSVIEWKKRMGREKDKNDLKLIEQYQSNIVKS